MAALITLVVGLLVVVAVLSAFAQRLQIPDAISAAPRRFAAAQSLGLSRRIVTVLEGESMVNDATGLVIYRFAAAAVVTRADSGAVVFRSRNHLALLAYLA